VEWPIFVGGVNRSGTSLMRRLIGSHSQVAMPPTDFDYFKRIMDPGGPVADRAAFAARTEAFLAAGKVRMWHLDEAAVRRAAAETEPTDKALFLLVLHQYREQAGKSRIAQKTPHLEEHVAVLDEWFGEGYRFVHLVRHPVDCFASNLFYAGRRRTVYLHGWASRWVDSVTVALRRSFTHRATHRLVRYEDLVADPELVLAEICRFTGLAFERERMLSMSDFDQKDNSSFSAVADERVYEQKVRKRDDVDRSRRISEAELAAVRRLCGPLAHLVGYELERGLLAPAVDRATFALDELSLSRASRAVGRYAFERVGRGIRKRLGF
jgi:Sulfotransferase family